MIYAGFWRRWAGAFIDGLICVLPVWAMNQLMPLPYIGGFGGIVVGLFYIPLFLSSPLQATPGKAIMGTAVVYENGDTLTLKTAIIRYLAAGFSALIFFIGYFMNLFTPKRQTLHDMIVGSVVIMKTPPAVNYFQIWLNEIRKLGGDQTVDQNTSYSAPQNATSPSATKAIEDLHKLFQSGAITQSEYDLKKEELLKKI